MDVALQNAAGLFKFDSDQLYVLIEIVQLAFITFCLVMGVIYLIDRVLVYTFHDDYKREEEVRRFEQKNTIEVSLILFVRILLYCFIYYYVIKVIKVVPSVPTLLCPSFRPHQSMNVVIDIVFLVLLIHLSDFLLVPMNVLSDKLLKF